MKKITLIALLFAYSFSSFAQDDYARKSEVKLNMFNVIAFKMIDVSYEYIINEESTVGASLLFSPNSTSNLFDDYRKFSLTPYYRHFFSEGNAEGLFLETFAMIHSGDQDPEELVVGGLNPKEKYTDFAIGIGGGYKIVSEKGFVVEVYLGFGRDLLGNNHSEVTGRSGISLGYRF